MTRRTTESTTQRISGPAELLQAIPYLLGFHPTRSLVLVGLAQSTLVVTARLDLSDALSPGGVEQTVAAIARGGSSEAVCICYDDGVGAADSGLGTLGDPLAELVARTARAAEASDCAITEMLWVSAGRWRSLRCESADCCPPGGRPMPDDASAFAAAATYAGMVALPDRAALALLLAPLPDAERARLQPELELAEHEAVAAILDGHGARHVRSVKRALFAAARASAAPDWTAPDHATAATFGAALTDISLRDAVWMAVDDGRIDGRPLWRDLGRRLPAPYDAPPLFLYGWASWRAGDGAQAGIAADRAVDSDPDYSAADLLSAALARGVDPRRLPKLRLPRSA